ncbi:MAG: dicarboxylate/amino acid:cation symporter [Pseudomonadota bacterium]|nr:dicarboxylate/amino acid:cation symporter [Pseudomonadota bacterium]MED5274882.1 dicarboxylate/amino acid:cation symporter [Pseudomonadota bacterium]MED5430155.1 dicarboxylate/amino acid:cation symporter [Pseudomonadota bacterium]|tara:strand:- start:10059 stop:11303 length:1245 start_codon:yes stop_codon:yes gene_type:complete
MSFTKQVLYSMLFGIFFGLALNVFIIPNELIETFLIENIFTTLATIFILLLKMIVLPLIFVSLISGIVSINDTSALGRIGLKTITLYILTTIVAISLALLSSTLVGYDQQNLNLGTSLVLNTDIPEPKNYILTFFPENFFASLADGNVIHVLVFAIFLGIAASLIKEEIKVYIDLIDDLNKILNKLVILIIKLTPIAVFCLLAKTFATQGIEVFIPLAKYFFLVIFVLMLHFTITYSILLQLFTSLNLKRFYNKIKSILIFTFSTASSNASIPFTLNAVINKFGVKKSVASFSIPLGATINMDGTAIMQGCATYFLATFYGIDLSLNDYITIIITATLASIGTAGIPSAGILMLSIILTEIGIPLEGITLLLGVDRLLDMIRTSVNVTGDTCITCIVAKSENMLDEKKYNLDEN